MISIFNPAKVGSQWGERIQQSQCSTYWDFVGDLFYARMDVVREHFKGKSFASETSALKALHEALNAQGLYIFPYDIGNVKGCVWFPLETWRNLKVGGISVRFHKPKGGEGVQLEFPCVRFKTPEGFWAAYQNFRYFFSTEVPDPFQN